MSKIKLLLIMGTLIILSGCGKLSHVDIPSDLSAPSSPTNVSVMAGDSQAAISWENPTESDLLGVLVRRKTDVYPSNVNDGEEVFNNPGAGFIDTGLNNGQTYYYTIWSVNENYNYSQPVNTTANPYDASDTTAPSSVTGFSASAGSGELALSNQLILNWSNPGDADFAGVIIRRSTISYPMALDEGIAVYCGSNSTFTDTGLTNGQTYYYGIWAYDNALNLSATVNVSGIPNETVEEFQVNTTSGGDQKNCSVAQLSDGKFVVTFIDEDHNDVLVQMFNADGSTYGTELKANSKYNYYEDIPMIAGLSNGGFVVVWTNAELYGQIFDSTGSKVGSEFLINNYTNSEQSDPDVAGLSNGNFIVVWESGLSDNPGPDGDRKSVQARIFNSNGNAVSSEFQVNTYTYKHQKDPAVSAFNDGGFVISWESRDQDGDQYAIMARVYDNDGNAQSSEVYVNTTTAGDQKWSDVSTLTNGGFVVVWLSGDAATPPTYYDGVYARIYDQNGNAQTAEFRVNQTNFINIPVSGVEMSPNDPAVAGLSDGTIRFVYDNMDDLDGSGYGIFSRIFDTNGNALTDETQVNTYTDDNQEQPAIAALSDRECVIVWESKGQDGGANGKGIYGIVK